MAKKQQGPYDQYDDLQLLLRYAKLEDDYNRFVEVPRWAGEPVPQSQDMAVKIDKIVCELYRRGLTSADGKDNPLSQEIRDRDVTECLARLKLTADEYWKRPSTYVGPCPAACTALTPKAKALRPWADPSIVGKWSIFFHDARQEEIDAAVAPVKEKYEAIRKASCEEDNRLYYEIKARVEGKSDVTQPRGAADAPGLPPDAAPAVEG